MEWYGESKAEAERIASSYAEAIDVAVARPCRIVGPGVRLSLGGPPRGKHLALNRKLVQQLLASAWTCSGQKAETVLGFRPGRLYWRLDPPQRRLVRRARMDLVAASQAGIGIH